MGDRSTAASKPIPQGVARPQVKIAILAYGSLIWDEECLAPHITGGWRLGKGPRLPVEFCRISPKRKKALVLTIDPEQGHEVATSYTLSKRNDLTQAIADLAVRERCDERHIGFCVRNERLARRPALPANHLPTISGGWAGARGGGQSGFSAQAQYASPLHARIHAWLTRHEGLDAAIWAALPVNFRAETGRDFDHETAVDYLRSLPKESLAEAWRYITYAPQETDTPLRRHLARHDWWCRLDFHT